MTAKATTASSLRNWPEYDKYDRDLEKALKQVETIKKNYPDCQTLPNPQTGKPILKAVESLKDWAAAFKDKYPELKDLLYASDGEPKAMLTLVEEEIDFCRKVEAARDLLSSLALEVADKAQKEGRADDAKNYRALANDQIKILMELRGPTPQMQLLSAGIDVSNGKYDTALDTLYTVKGTVDRDSALYIDASHKISEVYAKMKNWKQAVEYPQGIAISLSGNFKSPFVRKYWPEMREFLKECYANGVPCPPQLKSCMEEDKAAEPPAGAPKQDDAKGQKTEAAPQPATTDEAKKEDLKKEAPKQEEAPKAEPKKEETK